MSDFDRTMSRILLFLLISVSVLLHACSTNTSRYRMAHDAAPGGQFDASTVPEPVPAWEPLSPRGNNSPYTVRGVKYHILDRAQGYVEEGIASWYGMKFHGEHTSNGEVYNMYAMTAAHKTLPLPSYVRVTNLEDGSSTIVRVNDRGPFHPGRIIDLSYAAAHKLGIDRKGTARVRVEAITLDQPVLAQTAREEQLKPFVQVAAYRNEESAHQVRRSLQSLLPEVVVFVARAVDQAEPLFRVRVGPFADHSLAERARARIAGAQIGNPMVIVRALSGPDR
jgi:rare lipoprotein A